jgi:hypothetical protein
MLTPNLESALTSLRQRLPSLGEKERKEAAQLLARLEWSQENEALRYFQPHGGQIAYVADIFRPGAFIVVTGAGNGWGKSEILAAIFAAIMWPSLAPAALQGPLTSNWRYPKRARIYSKPAELEEIGSLQTAIARLFPKGRYTASKGRYSYPSVFQTDNGWTLDLFSYERHESEAAGPNIGLQAFNEPPPEPLWKEAIARSRAGGIILGGMTSLSDQPWIVSGLFDKADGKDIRVRYGNSCENCRQHGTNGNLEHSQIERILAQYDPDEREARFTGKPLSLSGRIYKTFDRNVHVREFDVPTDNSVSHGMIVDPAIGKPLAILWRFVDRAGVVHYYDESPEFDFEGAKDSNLTVKDYALLFRAKEEGKRIDTRILDRHFGNVRRTMGGQTLKEQFADTDALGNLVVEFQDSYAMDPAVEVETGILKVKEYLRYDTAKPIDAINRPRIVVHPRCKNTIAAFEKWSRNPKTYKPLEQFKDFMDLVRYDLATDPKIEDISHWPSVNRPFYGVQA